MQFADNQFEYPSEGVQGKMHQVLKLFFLFICILVGAFFANYYGYITVPWLEFNSVPTYGSSANAVDSAVKQITDAEIDHDPE